MLDGLRRFHAYDYTQPTLLIRDLSKQSCLCWYWYWYVGRMTFSRDRRRWSGWLLSVYGFVFVFVRAKV